MKKVLSVLCMALLAGGMIFTSCTKTYTITTATNFDGWGTVTGGGTYAEGAEVTLKAVPAVGYVFVEWTDGVKENPRTITVTGDALYTAHFRKASREVNVTFKNTNWSAGRVTGEMYNQVTWDVYAEKTADDYPIADICMATTDETIMYNRCNSESGKLTSSNFKWIEYYEEYSLQDQETGFEYGDWWAKNVTVEIYEFDATNLEVNANVDAVMFYAREAFVQSAGAVGVEAAQTTSMKEDIINIKLESAKSTPKKLNSKNHGQLVAIRK